MRRQSSADKITHPQAAFERPRHDAQHRRCRLRSKTGTKMREAFEAKQKKCKGNVQVGKRSKRLTQMRIDHRPARHSGDHIHAVGKLATLTFTITGVYLLQVFEGFNRADNGTVLVMDRNSVNTNRKFVSSLVTEKTSSLR